MNTIHPLILLIIDVVIYLYSNLGLLLLIVPKLLQMTGIIGWLWEGINVYRDKYTNYRYRKLLRATLTWLTGRILELYIIPFLLLKI